MRHIRGRFSKPALDSVIKYTSSLPFDYRLYPEDVRGSVAHARMLAHQGIITEHEAQELKRDCKPSSMNWIKDFSFSSLSSKISTWL
jgi:argininosuccinate lyase